MILFIRTSIKSYRDELCLFFDDFNIAQRGCLMIFHFIMETAKRFLGTIDRNIDGSVEIVIALGDDDGVFTGDDELCCAGYAL